MEAIRFVLVMVSDTQRSSSLSENMTADCYPNTQCMVYLSTFTIESTIHVGEYPSPVDPCLG